MQADYCPICKTNLQKGRFWLTVCPSCKFDLESQVDNCPICKTSLQKGNFWLTVCPSCDFDLEDPSKND